MYFLDALMSTGLSVLFFIAIRFFVTKFITKESFNLFTPSGFAGLSFFAIIVFSFNYFWVDTNKNVTQEESSVSGQHFTAPENVMTQKPLELQLEFDKKAHASPATMTTITTDLARYVFSSHGACIESMNMFWQNGAITIPLIMSENPSLMVGLNGMTPFNYELVNVSEHDALQAYIVEYKAVTHDGTLFKTFTVYKKTYQIDVVAKYVAKQKDVEQQLRLFVSSPVVADELKGIVNKPGSAVTSLQDIAVSKAQTFTDFWFEPKTFGFTTKFLTAICFTSSSPAMSRTYFKKLSDDQMQFIVESKAIPNETEVSWSLYVGPKVQEALSTVSPKLTSLMQYGWLTPLAKPVLRLMVYLHQETGSYGLAIILIALLIKLLLLPFTLKSERSLKQQAEFDKKRAYLQQKFKHDKAALDQATAELINKHGFPMLSGCLPMLLNIPVFFALNKVLSSAIQLHGSSFLWVPDLSAADPYYILSMMVFVAMLLTPAASADPRQWMSRVGFALFLAGVTAYLASGLALFIMMNTALGVVQSYVVRKAGWLAA